jgi:hypothetical protein
VALVSPFSPVSTRGVTLYTYIFRCSACGKHGELKRMPESLDGNRSLIAAFELAGLVVCTHGAPRCAGCLALPILFAVPERHAPVARTVRLPGPPCSLSDEGLEEAPDHVDDGHDRDGEGEEGGDGGPLP